jgi:hypothetical protein
MNVRIFYSVGKLDIHLFPGGTTISWPITTEACPSPKSICRKLRKRLGVMGMPEMLEVIEQPSSEDSDDSIDTTVISTTSSLSSTLASYASSASSTNSISVRRSLTWDDIETCRDVLGVGKEDMKVFFSLGIQPQQRFGFPLDLKESRQPRVTTILRLM